MEETSLRSNLAPESLTRSFSVDVPATRKLRAFLHSFLFALSSFPGSGCYNAFASEDSDRISGGVKTLTWSQRGLGACAAEIELLRKR